MKEGAAYQAASAASSRESSSGTAAVPPFVEAGEAAREGAKAASAARD